MEIRRRKKRKERKKKKMKEMKIKIEKKNNAEECKK